VKPITQKWVDRFLDQAALISTWSKDASTKVGCVAVKDRTIIAQGYNGFPTGVDDSPERYAERELKYKLVVHAERNAVYNAAWNGVSLRGAELFVHGLPCCHECAKAVIQSGVSRIWMRYAPSDRWTESFEVSKLMFQESGVEFVCFEIGAGLHTGPHREQGSPGPRDEPVG
jgi:dCMP deaminase